MSAPIQTNFPLFALRPEHDHVLWLRNLLLTRGWLTRRQIIELAGLPRSNQRWVRALAEAAGADIVKGQKGFNHVANCTPEEINHSANQSIAQGKLMIRYGIRLRKKAHQVIEHGAEIQPQMTQMNADKKPNESPSHLRPSASSAVN